MKIAGWLVVSSALAFSSVIMGLTMVDAYGDIGCAPHTSGCWPTDWREPLLDALLMVASFIGAGVCFERAMNEAKK